MSNYDTVKYIQYYYIRKELIDRYTYLYENKELILAMCIRATNKKEKEYYLSKKVEDELTSAFEEFLFTDDNIKNTKLYKHIEAVKKDEKFLASFNSLIEEVLITIENNPFTVWKILTYVKNNNINNTKVLEALDKYYNLDKDISTNINCENNFKLPDNNIEKDKRINRRQNYKTAFMSLLANMPNVDKNDKLILKNELKINNKKKKLTIK